MCSSLWHSDESYYDSAVKGYFEAFGETREESGTGDKTVVNSVTLHDNIPYCPTRAPVSKSFELHGTLRSGQREKLEPGEKPFFEGLVDMADEGANRRNGDRYELTEEEVESYKTNGYVHLKGVVSEEEVRSLEDEYMSFIRREVAVEGRDFCDMSADYSKPLEDYSIVNIMLPSKYKPKLKGNIYERRAASVSEQLLGPDMVLDYDQLLAKPPGKSDGVFHWHQDLAYWPLTKDTRTASFWLAIDTARVENGCIQFVPGSHLEKGLRHHGPLHGDRDKSHTLAAQLSGGDVPKPAEINRGDVTVHHERILHGSGANSSPDSWRRAWVVAFRSKETVEYERRIGFTHSHNDKLDVLNAVGKEDN